MNRKKAKEQQHFEGEKKQENVWDGRTDRLSEGEQKERVKTI